MSVGTFLTSARDRLAAFLPVQRYWLALALAPVLVVVLAGIAFLITYRIDDDLDLAPDPAYTVAGGSKAVAIAATLIHRQTHIDGWSPSKLWFHPSSWSRNMRNYQTGIQEATARFITEMADSVG